MKFFQRPLLRFHQSAFESVHLFYATVRASPCPTEIEFPQSSLGNFDINGFSLMLPNGMKVADMMEVVGEVTHKCKWCDNSKSILARPEGLRCFDCGDDAPIVVDKDNGAILTMHWGEMRFLEIPLRKVPQMSLARLSTKLGHVPPTNFYRVVRDVRVTQDERIRFSMRWPIRAPNLTEDIILSIAVKGHQLFDANRQIFKNVSKKRDMKKCSRTSPTRSSASSGQKKRTRSQKRQ